MSIYYDKKRRRYRFEFDRIINGNRVRATKLLPAAWNQAQADKFDREESGRLYAIAQGVQQEVPLVETAVEYYLKSKSHLKSHLHAARHLNAVLPYYAGKRIDQLPDIAKEVSEKEANNWKPATIKQRIALMRAACRFLWKQRRLSIVDPASHLIMPEVSNARQQYVTRAEMLRLCRKISHRHARALLLIAFYSGMRRGEIWTARVQGGMFVLSDTKNGEPRHVPIVPKVANYARKHLPPRISYRWLVHHLKIGAAAIGRIDLRLHDLRHSTATSMIQAGVSLYAVGKVLGHKSPASTARYSHLATQEMQDALLTIARKKETSKNPHTPPAGKPSKTPATH